MSTDAQIYVGTYAKYNDGNLKGAWLQLADYADRGEFLEACAKLHADESDPELMFQDFEGFPRCWYSESSAPAEILWEWLELSEDEQKAFAIYAENIGDGADLAGFRDVYFGTADSEADFAQQQAEAYGDIPKDLASWIVIDWEASWNSGLRFDYFTGRDEDGTVHFFHNA